MIDNGIGVVGMGALLSFLQLLLLLSQTPLLVFVTVSATTLV